MSLDLGKLEKVREFASGIVQARCPACAESGGDRKGEHLRIYPDGAYGCCVYPKDGEHRKRIHALAGVRSKKSFTIRLAPVPTVHPPTSIKSCLLAAYTPPAAIPETRIPETACSCESDPDVRTLRTPFFQSRAYAKEELYTYKDLENAVLPVLTGASRLQLPFLSPDGTLVIPFGSPDRYHWWRPDGDRFTVAQIISELKQAQAAGAVVGTTCTGGEEP